MPYVYPHNYELKEIGPIKQARMSAGRVGLELMPIREVNAGEIRWSQRDNYRGLQQLRGLDGSPLSVTRHGAKEYSYDPGIYGEFMTISETELTKRAGSTHSNEPIQIGDLVGECQDRLIQRELDRIEMLNWAMLLEGKIGVSNPTGIEFKAQFAIQSQAVTTAWTDAANSTPLLDMQTASLLGVGLGASFGAGAKCYINKVRAHQLVRNRNNNDLFGTRLSQATTTTMKAINDQLAAEALPTFEVYDEGYYTDANVFTRFIPNTSSDGEYTIWGVIVGQRPSGDVIGEYVKTRNLNNANGAPGSYDKVKDFTGNADDRNAHIPPKIEVHRGHNGGPILYFPSNIIVLRTKL